jgi:hypothetical protein
VWRTKVVRVLRRGDPNAVLVTAPARKDWASLPSNPWDYELFDALADALDSDDITGRRQEMDEPGETHEFIFSFAGVKVYAKVNLTTSGEVVTIYPAHRPLKGNQVS